MHLLKITVRYDPKRTGDSFKSFASTICDGPMLHQPKWKQEKAKAKKESQDLSSGPTDASGIEPAPAEDLFYDCLSE